MHANVGPTCAPGRRVSANPAEKRSMSEGASYNCESLVHRWDGISGGEEPQEQYLGMPQNSLW